jgi:hypothetical protein
MKITFLGAASVVLGIAVLVMFLRGGTPSTEPTEQP